jgi:hypothetical protein
MSINSGIMITPDILSQFVISIAASFEPSSAIVYLRKTSALSLIFSGGWENLSLFLMFPTMPASHTHS